MTDKKEMDFVSNLFIPIAILYYIVAVFFLIIGVIGISVALQKEPIKLFKKLHHAMLVPQVGLRI
jgi:hypothetical protein